MRLDDLITFRRAPILLIRESVLFPGKLLHLLLNKWGSRGKRALAAVSDRVDGRNGKGERSQNTSNWKGPIKIIEFNSQRAKNTSRISGPEEWASTLAGNIEHFPCQHKYLRHFSHKLHRPHQAAGSCCTAAQPPAQGQIYQLSPRDATEPEQGSCRRQKMGSGAARTESRARPAHSKCRQANSK